MGKSELMVKAEHRCSSGLEASGRAGAQKDLELVLRSKERWFDLEPRPMSVFFFFFLIAWVSFNLILI